MQGPPLHDVPRRHANETLTAERPNLEGEFQDVAARLEVLTYRAMSVHVHKAWGARDVLVTSPARRAWGVRSARNDMHGATHLRGSKALRCAVTAEIVGATPAELDKRARARCLLYPDIRFLTTAWMPGWLPCIFSCSDSLFFDFVCGFAPLNCPRLEDLIGETRGEEYRHDCLDAYRDCAAGSCG